MLFVFAGAAVAYFLLSGPDSQFHGEPASIRVISSGNFDPSAANVLARLNAAGPALAEYKTNLSEQPVWVVAELSDHGSSGARSFHLPSRHARRVSAWLIDEDGHVVLHGQTERGGDESVVRESRAGFRVDVPETLASVRLVARVESKGPARISVEIWKTADLSHATRQFDQAGGVLFGSLLMIAAFGALIAALVRDSTFFVFSAWSVTSLRFAAYSSGWDFTWLGLPMVDEYPGLVRNLPLAAYAFLTIALFRGIFKRDIARLKASTAIRLLLAISALMLVVSVLLPQRVFLPIMWSLAVPSLLYMMGLTLVIFARTGSTVALWYCASWLATMSASVAEIAFATGLITRMPALLNSVSGAVFSVLLAAIALAGRIKSERMGRVQAQARTVNVLNKFKENYNSMPVGLFSLSGDGRVTLYNPSFAEMFGLPRVIADDAGAFIDSVVGSGTFSRLRIAAAESGGSDIELSQDRRHDHNRWFLARVTMKNGSVEGSIQDITARKAAETQLQRLVDHDHLTGVLNRRGLEALIAAAIERVRAGEVCAIAHVELDRFKLTNDLHGHATGDALLQQAAVRISGAIRSRDKLARIADSFVVVLEDCPEEAAMGLTERVRAAVGERAFDIDGKGLNITASVGVVPIEPGMSALDAMAAGDRACSEAKARGRNCVVRLTEQDSSLRAHLEELKVVADLQQRIPTERYFLEFQPIVQLGSAMTSLSYEVLIRMRGEQGQVIPPGKFIGAAERNGLMAQIDRWVLRSTLEWLDAHPDHREKLAFATINISGASLNDTRFADDAFAMIAEHPLSTPKLCFEITESVALHDIGSTRRFVDRVRTYGSKLALDDFGAGYTSFNYLKEIPADFIKIDGSFVRDINRNPANYAITRTIVELAHELGMRSIAEWAETADTIQSLLDLHVDFGQGFGLVRPISPDRLATASSSGALITDMEVVSLLQSKASRRSPVLKRLRFNSGSS